MSTRVPLVYGAAAFGAEGTITTRIHELAECQKSVDYFVGKGFKVFDTSRVYGDGTSEEYLAKLDLKGAVVDTKAYVHSPGDHSPEKLRESLQASLKALHPHKVRVFFLHVPDRSIPYEETLRGVNELYKEGLFEEFGLSNYTAWEVSEIATIAKLKGWIRPTVYQGLYNALERNVETELFPCLRKHGLRFHAFSPLARGLLAGTNMMSPAPGSRWDISSSPMASGLLAKYQDYGVIVQQLMQSLEKYNLSGAETALRWLQHHSCLTPEDAVIIGASSLRQLEANVTDSEKGALPSEVVTLLDEVWTTYKGRAPPYFR
ncbi:NADP-dependent oxidoreductase domain-containing protein [Phlebopus sp. FC_14]|nr:NADP-dependent oxidoreductase domain-containing protein [Phlebopus sp. FC_14]